MWSLISSLAGSVGGLVALLAVVAGLIGVGAYEEHRVDLGKLNAIEASYAQAQARAVAEAAATQKQLDAVTLAAVNTESKAQTQLSSTLQQELADVPVRVVVKSIPCVPWGLVRLLDATILGVSAASLNLPAGKSDGSCSPYGADELARTIVSNYGRANANAEQLNALQAWARRIAEAHK